MATVATVADTAIVGENEDQLVTMIVDNQLFGIPILQVQDIVEASKITPVPLAPSAIAGVLNLRGRIVTVVDLRKLLDNHEEVPWESQMGVTVEYKGDLYTLLVDAIGDVRTLPKRDFDKAPSTMESNVRRLCAGIYRLRGNLLVVLDVARILHTEVIEATPMLTVEERRSRKNMAATGSDGGDARTHQLSALMTDLNAYESETEGVFGAGPDSSEDNLKSRKRAGRDRRPVAERWKEVLEEKARKSGHVTYLMREPDEETIENARSEMAKEDAEWAARIKDGDDSLPDGTDEGSVPDAAIDDVAPDLPLPAAPEFDDGFALGSTGDAPSSAEAAPEPPAERRDSRDQEPFVLDPVLDMPVEESTTETREPVLTDAPAEMPAEEPGTEVPKREEPDPTAETAAEQPKAEDRMPPDLDFVPDMPAEQPGLKIGDLPEIDTAPELPADEPKAVSPGPTASAGGAGTPQPPVRESSGISSGWWNKLRGKTGDDTGEPEKTEPDPGEDSPGDETPATKKTAAKPKSKAKTKAKGSSKAGAKSKARPRTKKKT